MNPKGNPSTLKPFKPGQSGNPSGRPKGKSVTDYVREQLDGPIPRSMLEAMKEPARTIFFEVYGAKPTFGQMLAFRLVQLSAKGDMMAMRELLDRSEGKVINKVDVSGEVAIKRVVADL